MPPARDEFDPQSARLYCIVARAARQAVIFRRGPSRRVRLLVWHLKDDTLGGGQWFKGRIYERRCDLTPSGDKLIYFAASFRQPLYSWSAISKPPYLTALALWPKGDCWGGGGLWTGPSELQLNHHRVQLKEGFTLPRNLIIRPLGDHSGQGEDEPIMAMRRLRDGWVQASDESRRRSQFLWTFDPPLTWQKLVARRLSGALFLRMHLHAIHETQGRWYVETADLTSDGQIIFELGRVDWADLDHNGDVLYAKQGCLYRLRKPPSRYDATRLVPHLVADLNNMNFETIPAPAQAQRWN